MAPETKVIHPVTRRSFLKISGSLALGSALLSLSSLSKELHPLKKIQRSAFTMGSIATLTAYHTDERECNRAIDEAIKEIKLIDSLMSVFNPHSQVSLLNRNAFQKEVIVDERIIEVIERARQFARVTSSAFDVTVEPLMKLYGFREEHSSHRLPSDKELTNALNGIGIHNIEINKEKRAITFRHEATKLDFGGIAVGYAIDRAARILSSRGIESALINHSGDMYALGSPPDEDSWEIGIVDPEQTDEIITTTRITNQALSTSGNYENYVEADGKHIGHLLDPVTGKPATHILSGTTIAPSAIEADAFSTGMFVMGVETTNNMLRNVQGVRFVAIIDGGNGKEMIML